MNNNPHPVPYEVLVEKYLESQREIEYLEYKISSYYKVVVFIVPLQGLYAILLEILWIVLFLLPPDGLREATTTVSLYIC